MTVHIALLWSLWTESGARAGSNEPTSGGGSAIAVEFVEFVEISSSVQTQPLAALDQAQGSADSANLSGAPSGDTATVELTPAPDDDQPVSRSVESGTSMQELPNSPVRPTSLSSLPNASANPTQVAGVQGAAGTAIDNGLEARYMAALRQAIMTHWTGYQVRKVGEACSLTIRQVSGGQVHSALSGTCALDQASRRALEAAALMAQPLPYQGFESVFREEMVLEFGSN